MPYLSDERKVIQHRAVERRIGDGWSWRCDCGWQGPFFASKKAAEADADGHVIAMAGEEEE